MSNLKATHLSRYVPILRWSRSYQRAWLRSDVVAGMTIVALLVPEGMAYAQIAGVPPQTAFYAAPIGLLAFAIFGSSRQLVVAVSAAIASMSFATVSLLAEPNAADFIVLTAALAVLSGVIALLAGALKLGRVAQFFSESVMVGFISGLALVIAIKQVPKILGIEGGDGNFWERLRDLVVHLDETHFLTLVVGAVCLVLLLAIEHFFERIPAALVALVAGIAVSAAFGLEGHGVEIVGDIPSGLAAPRWPSIGLDQWGLLFAGALGLALISFAEAIGPSRSFAAAHHYEIDANQEFIGLGVANIGAGLFQGFPIGSSLSKSAANDRAGARSQLSGIIAAAVTALVALFFTGLFRDLPEAVLGAIVVVAVSGMVKTKRLKHLYEVGRGDFLLASVALLAVLTFETLQALLVAVVVSLLALVARVSKPRLAVLGRVPDGVDFSDIGRHPENTTVPGMVIVRPENGLFFANSAGMRDAILSEATTSTEQITAVLIDLGATTELDVPSCDMIDELRKQLSGLGIRIMFTRVIASVRTTLEQAGVMDDIPASDVFAGPIEAVLDHLSSQHDEAGVDDVLRGGALTVQRMQQEYGGGKPEPS